MKIWLPLGLCMLILGSCEQFNRHPHANLEWVHLEQLTSEKNYWDSIPGILKVRDKYRPNRYYLDNEPFTGEVRDSSQSGKPKAIGKMKDGYRDGPWQYYQYNGYPDQTGCYENGYMTGKWKFYDKKGQEKKVLVYTVHGRDVEADTLLVVYKDGSTGEPDKDRITSYYPETHRLRSTITMDRSTGSFYDEQGRLVEEMKDYIKENKQTGVITFYVAKGTHKEAMNALLAFDKTKWTEAQKLDFEKANSVTITPHRRPNQPPPPLMGPHSTNPSYSGGFEVNIETIR